MVVMGLDRENSFFYTPKKDHFDRANEMLKELGVYLHGCAGDTAAFNKGFHSMTASDVLDAIPELLKEITLD